MGRGAAAFVAAEAHGRGDKEVPDADAAERALRARWVGSCADGGGRGRGCSDRFEWPGGGASPPRGWGGQAADQVQRGVAGGRAWGAVEAEDEPHGDGGDAREDVPLPAGGGER